MKILVIGFLALFGWFAISTHIWVCNVLGLCNDSIANNSEKPGYGSIAAADSLNGTFTPVRPVIPGNLSVYFEFDKSDFISDSLTERYFAASKSYLDYNTRAVINIEGNTDSIGSDNYNQELGYRRAQTMQYYFKSKGLQEEKISIESKGERNPAADNNTSGGRANNRRTVITIKN